MQVIERQWKSMPVKVEEENTPAESVPNEGVEQKPHVSTEPSLCYPYPPLVMGYSGVPYGLMPSFGWMGLSVYGDPRLTGAYLQ